MLYSAGILSVFSSLRDFFSGENAAFRIAGACFVALAVIVIFVLLIQLTVRHSLTFLVGEGKTIKYKFPRRRMVRLTGEQSDVPVPSREGFTFAGWYLDEACTVSAGDIYRVEKDAALYAKWVPAEKAAEDIAAPVEEASAEEPAAPVAEETAEDIAVPAEEVVAGEPAAPVAEETAEDIAAPAEEVVAEEPAAPVAEETAGAITAPVEEAPAAVEEEDGEEEEDAEDEAAEGDEFDNALVTLVSGSKVFVQYRRSFRARLIQASDEMKEYYNLLRSELLSQIGVKERVSWNFDSFNVGRRQFAKVNANTKSLIVYFALSPEEVDEKYRFRDVSEKKRYANVPVRYKITGSRSFKYALELLEQTAEKFGLDFKRVQEHLDIPYEDRDALIRQRLIRVYAKRETGETVTEEELEKYIEEGATVEKLSAYTVTDKVTAGEAETLITDATAENLIALAEVRSVRGTGRRSYINLDTISANFREGETVDLATLKARGLLEAKVGSFKVLARGQLDKSLTVEANDFSLAAVKMIALTGGKVVRIKKQN